VSRPPGWWLPAAAVVIVAAVFFPALSGTWVKDDLQLVSHHVAFRGLGYLWEAVASPFWGQTLSYWRPVSSAALCVGASLGGGGAWALHALALGAHLLSVSLAFALVRRLTGSRSSAFVAGLLFGLHPVQVEPVSWVAAISDPLAGCGALAALWAWVRWRERGRGMPWSAWIATAVALGSKEVGIMVLPLVVALDACRGDLRGATRRDTMFAYFGLAAVAALYAAARALAFHDAGFGAARASWQPAESPGLSATLAAYLAGRFLGVLLLPVELTLFRHVPPALGAAHSAFWPAAAGAAAFVAIAAALALRRRRVAAFACAAVALPILPVVLLPHHTNHHPVLDRYLYLSVFGYALLLAAGAGALPRWRTVAHGALLLLAAAFAVRSAMQIPVWRSHAALVERAVAAHGDNPDVQYMAAALALERYQASGDRAALAAARAGFERAHALMQKPLFGRAALERTIGADIELGRVWGRALAGEGTPAEWARAFEVVIGTAPENANARIGAAMAYAEQGDLHRAERSLLAAVELDPSNAQAAHNLGLVHLRAGNVAAAHQWFRESLRRNPNNEAAKERLRSVERTRPDLADSAPKR
jgi:tetratricopeptide (TPR) repeat protein